MREAKSRDLGHFAGLLMCLLGAAVVLWPGSGAAQMLETPLMQAADVGEPSRRDAGDEDLIRLLREGDVEQLRAVSRRRDDPASLVARAYTAELDGNFESALRFAKVASRQAGQGPTMIGAELAVARLLKARGDWKAAEERLRSVISEHPDAHTLRAELGELLVDRGKPLEAETLLDRMTRDFNNGRINSTIGLGALGRAMALLGGYKDANHAFQLAYEKDKKNLPALTYWGRLFLSKYNTADAERTFKDVLKVNPNHPGALVGMARVVMESSNYYDEARDYLRKAEEVYPTSSRVRLTRAELAIYDGDWKEAMKLARTVLGARPKHLDALAIVAAVHYLRDDTEKFEATKKKALAIKPDFAGLLTETARFAKLVHRYEETVELHRKALELKRDDAEALLGLGMGLSRLGKLDRAVTTLQKAFNADPYNVRAYNMLNLFEKTMPKYTVYRHDGFLLRTHRSQDKIIDTLVAPLVAESLEVYTDKYDFEPADELSVEIYPDPQTFGVRTVGLPNISPHGICFGRVVATRSPSDGNFNWRQVVWHEMAHVYHIQEGNYRVPRWFTEGLAEYETNVKDPAWIRHHDRSIAAALRDGDIPSILDLDRRFTQAKSYLDILQAYHLSSLVIHFIVEEWSYAKVAEMVERFETDLRTEKVIANVLEVEVEEFDKRLREWLGRQFMNFEQQLLVDLRGFPPVQQLKEQGGEKDGYYWAQMAVGRLRAGDKAGAKAALERALSRDGDDPKVHFVAMELYNALGETLKAWKHGNKVLELGGEDYALRVRLGRLARMRENLTAAEVHLDAAVQLWEDGAEAWKQLASLAESRDDREMRRRAMRRLFELDQTSPQAARAWTEMNVEQERWEQAWAGVDRWISIQPFEPEVHRARVEIAMQLKRPKAAAESWTLLGRIRPSNRDTVFVQAVKNFRENGYGELAEEFAGKAKEAGAAEEKIREALGK